MAVSLVSEFFSGDECFSYLNFSFTCTFMLVMLHTISPSTVQRSPPHTEGPSFLWIRASHNMTMQQSPSKPVIKQ
jgi:hypothetical protein